MHDQVFGYEHPSVIYAYDQAMERGLYDDAKVARQALKIPQGLFGAYAATNCLEYFAELSATYLNMNTGYFPMTREQLMDHEKVGYNLVESFWKCREFTVVNELPFPISLCWVGGNSRQHKLFDLKPKEQRNFECWHRLKLVGESMLNGEKYRFERPKAGETVWRLSAESIAKR
jgi:hypothetical protein